MRVTPWRGKVCQQPRNVFCRVNALGHVATLYPDTIFFFLFHRSSSSSCYHSRYHSMGTISTAYARGTTATLLRSRPTCHGIRRTVIDIARESLVFHFFCIILRLDPCRTGLFL